MERLPEFLSNHSSLALAFVVILGALLWTLWQSRGGGAKKLLLVGLPLLLVGLGVLVATGALSGGGDEPAPRDPGAVAIGNGGEGPEPAEVESAPNDGEPQPAPVDDDAAERLFELAYGEAHGRL